MRRLVLLLLFLLGLGLRLWNAETAYVHGDDHHTASDAKAVQDLPPSQAIPFLRDHPRNHPRYHPIEHQVTSWAGPWQRAGHPALQAYLVGPFIDLLGPEPLDRVRVMRGVNAVVSSLTILLLPAVVAAAGGGTGAGLLAAALYAVLPPVVVYDSIGNPEALLEPLLVALVLLCLRGGRGLGRWVAAGFVTGLALNVELPGLVALVLVPIYFAAWPERRPAALVAWAVTTAIVFVAFTNPVAYVEGLLDPGVPYRVLRADVTSTVGRNVEMLANPSEYYWLSVGRHSLPLARHFGRPHYLLTPGVLFLALVGFVLLAVRRQWRGLLALAVPALLVLALVPPSDGLWRVLPMFPFACGAAAYAFATVGLLGRLALLVPVVAFGAYPFLPQYIPSPEGTVDFERIYLRNPWLKPGHRFHSARSAQVLGLAIRQKVDVPIVLERGAWAPIVTGELPCLVTIDGNIPRTISKRPPHVQLQEGWLHTLTIEALRNCDVKSLRLRRLGPQ